MPRIAFLSMDSLDGFVFDDDLAVGPLHELGWEVETVSWRTEEDWSRFEAVIIRTPWDYQDAPDEFMELLGDIERSGTRLENPLSVVRWNLSKTYLREMESLGVPIVPTRWGDAGMAGDIPRHVQAFDADSLPRSCGEFIVKPVISANADYTFRLTKDALSERLEELAEVFDKRAYLVQPFLQNVIDEGEFSLFYFNGEYSHTILKKPQTGDFRVQEEHGGIIQAVEAEPELLEAGRRTIANLPNLLYARADFVRSHSAFLLMELELIEPALYFRMDSLSAERFARAFDERMRQTIAA